MYGKLQNITKKIKDKNKDITYCWIGRFNIAKMTSHIDYKLSEMPIKIQGAFFFFAQMAKLSPQFV